MMHKIIAILRSVTNFVFVTRHNERVLGCVKYSVCLLLLSLNCHAWNAIGHKLVAQIAYNNLTPKAKRMCNKYTRAYNTAGTNTDFVSAATWMDAIRSKDIHWFDTLHYMDLPFSSDNTPLPVVQDINALWGIKQAMAVLSSKKSSLYDKGLSLRILTHLAGDVHQPLHTITKVSKQLPKGDLGGNLFPLAANPIGTNLHKYWDNGGGVLLGQRTKFQIKNNARQLENNWSCATVSEKNNPYSWIKASHKIALTQAYKISPNKVPGKRYQLNTQNTSQKQIVMAGCRLADLLNNIANKKA